jgi:hypothetical protein
MVHFVPIGPPHDDDQVVCEIRDDGEPGFGYIVAPPEVLGFIEVAMELGARAHEALNPGGD